MSSRIIENEAQREMLLTFIKAQPLPFTASITKGRKRSIEQNRLQRMWMNEVAEQLGDITPEEARAFCKLTIGVPLLRAQNDDFAEKYDTYVKPLPYENKLAFMAEPLDFPVTRLMTTAQHKEYLDEVHRYWTEQGIILTDPEVVK